MESFSNKTVFTTQSIPFNEFMELKTSTEKSKPITILEITRPLTYTSTSSEASIALETKPNNLITTLNDDSQLKSELINIYITLSAIRENECISLPFRLASTKRLGPSCKAIPESAGCGGTRRCGGARPVGGGLSATAPNGA